MESKPKESDRIKKAVAMATKAHEGQSRKTGEPYIVHPLAVKKILEEWGMDEDTIIAGILHDTIEDTDITLNDIKKEFGESVAFLVDGVTKLSTARNGMRDIDTYLPATKDNFLRLMIALGDDIRVLIIKLADRLHNLRTLSALPPDKQKKIAKESLEVFAPLADRLNMGLLRVEMADLSFKYVDPKRFDELKTLIDKYNKSAEKSLKRIEQEITAALKKEKIDFQLSGRVKSVYSLHMASSTLSTSRWKAASRTTSLCPSKTATNPSTLPSSLRTSASLNSRSAPKKCTNTLTAVSPPASTTMNKNSLKTTKKAKSSTSPPTSSGLPNFKPLPLGSAKGRRLILKSSNSISSPIRFSSTLRRATSLICPKVPSPSTSPTVSIPKSATTWSVSKSTAKWQI